MLDNFEQVLTASTLVHELLGAATGLTALVTSQASLRLREEREFPVPPLALPEPDGEGGSALAGSPAVEFFLDRARAVKPGFELTDENAAAVAGICRRLDGLPLAIELAAARVKLLSPQAILGRLEKRLDLLTGGAHDLPTRQRTLRDAIDWSYNLLEPSEQALLARLGVFAGGCSLEVADSVCGNKMNLGEVFEGLASLVDKSLVRQSDGADGEPRFGLLETIREYALERLEAEGELEELRRRHAERYLELVLAAEPELTRANQALWLVRLDEENDNIRAALSWTISSGEVELGLQLAGALVRFWSTRGLMGEGRRWLGEALAASEGVPAATLAKAHFAAGYAALGEGDFMPAKEAFDRSLELAQEVGDRSAEAATLAQLAWLAMSAGQYDEASELAEKSTELATETGDKLTASGALSTLAEIAAANEDYQEAIRLFESGLALRRGLGDKRLIANSLLRLGRAELTRGDDDRATTLLEEGLAVARQVRDTWSISVAVGNLGRVQLRTSGDPALAHTLLVEGLKLARDRNDKRVAAECIQGIAAVNATRRPGARGGAPVRCLGADARNDRCGPLTCRGGDPGTVPDAAPDGARRAGIRCRVGSRPGALARRGDRARARGPARAGADRSLARSAVRARQGSGTAGVETIPSRRRISLPSPSSAPLVSAIARSVSATSYSALAARAASSDRSKCGFADSKPARDCTTA